jgi:hypothetical protein
MTFSDHSNRGEPRRGGSRSFRIGLVLFGFLLIAGALMFTEHRAHVLGALIYLPLLLCPLMHLFMHHGHGGHHHQGDHGGPGVQNNPNGGSEP